ncbi:hypothetical protein KKB28_02085, partial [bacterium]|nr:hypothetical protein [bacterium]
MNPWKCFATILLCIVCILTAYSDGFSQLTPANSDDVVAIANNWLTLGQEMNWGWMTTLNFSPASIQEIRHQGELLAFSLPANGEGYIVIPAYHELPPITAYSTTSSLDVTQEEGLCGMLKEVLSYKIHLIRDYYDNPNPPPELLVLPELISDYRAQWQDYAANYSTFIKDIENENFSRGLDSEEQM